MWRSSLSCCVAATFSSFAHFRNEVTFWNFYPQFHSFISPFSFIGREPGKLLPQWHKPFLRAIPLSMSNTFQALILALVNDWTVKSQASKLWRLLSEAVVSKWEQRLVFPPPALSINPRYIKKYTLLPWRRPKTSTVLRLCNWPLLRVTLQSQTIDAVT